MAVCHPYDYRAAVTTQSVGRRGIKLAVPVILVSVLINIPKYFETITVEVRFQLQFDSLFVFYLLPPEFLPVSGLLTQKEGVIIDDGKTTTFNDLVTLF